jgi:hypothetical protein
MLDLRAVASSPSSHAETGETNTSPVLAAALTAARLDELIGALATIQISACVSSRTT